MAMNLVHHYWMATKSSNTNLKMASGRSGDQESVETGRILPVYAHGPFLFESIINFKIEPGSEKHYLLLLVLTFSDSESNRNERTLTLWGPFSQVQILGPNRMRNKHSNGLPG